MDANVSLDVGNNIKELIEKLAQQVGTTADKVFPWFVKQAVIEGWSFFIIMAGIVLVLLIAIGIFSVQASRKKDKDDKECFVVCTVVSCILLGLSFVVVAFGSPSAISKIMNPEYHAMTEVVKMVTPDSGGKCR